MNSSFKPTTHLIIACSKSDKKSDTNLTNDHKQYIYKHITYNLCSNMKWWSYASWGYIIQAFHIRKETTSITIRALFILWRMWESCTKMSKQENVQKSQHSQWENTSKKPICLVSIGASWLNNNILKETKGLFDCWVILIFWKNH